MEEKNRANHEGARRNTKEEKHEGRAEGGDCAKEEIAPRHPLRYDNDLEAAETEIALLRPLCGLGVERAATRAAPTLLCGVSRVSR